jgi:hypothetical protein
MVVLVIDLDASKPDFHFGARRAKPGRIGKPVEEKAGVCVFKGREVGENPRCGNRKGSAG